MSPSNISPAIAFNAKLLRNAGKVVIKDIDLTIRVGEIVALVGPNGGGKSTLISTLAGDNADIDYELKFFGTDVRGLTSGDLARVRSVIEQRASALVGYRVFETVSWGGFSRNVDENELQEIVQENLNRFRLTDVQNNRIISISGGQWARVLLARAATQAAPVFLGDEPDAALDSESTHLMYQWLLDSNVTAVIATHDVLSAQKYAHRILHVQNGLVTEQIS
jgi:iron complex transport system ATP-binding protein